MIECCVTVFICLASFFALQAQLQEPTFCLEASSSPPLFWDLCVRVYMIGATSCCPFSPVHTVHWACHWACHLLILSTGEGFQAEVGGFSDFSLYPHPPHIPCQASGTFSLLQYWLIWGHFYCQTLEQIASKRGEMERLESSFFSLMAFNVFLAGYQPMEKCSNVISGNPNLKTFLIVATPSYLRIPVSKHTHTTPKKNQPRKTNPKPFKSTL